MVKESSRRAQRLKEYALYPGGTQPKVLAQLAQSGLRFGASDSPAVERSEKYLHRDDRSLRLGQRESPTFAQAQSMAAKERSLAKPRFTDQPGP